MFHSRYNYLHYISPLNEPTEIFFNLWSINFLSSKRNFGEQKFRYKVLVMATGCTRKFMIPYQRPVSRLGKVLFIVDILNICRTFYNLSWWHFVIIFFSNCSKKIENYIHILVCNTYQKFYVTAKFYVSLVIPWIEVSTSHSITFV